MSAPSLFDPIPGGVRANPHRTEAEAAYAWLPKRGTQRARVLSFAASRVDGVTDCEVAQALGMLRGSASKRRGELTGLGLLVDSGQTRPTDTGCRAVVWRVTPVGKAAAARLG